jgi:hypothetical protein
MAGVSTTPEHLVDFGLPGVHFGGLLGLSPGLTEVFEQHPGVRNQKLCVLEFAL